MVKNSVYLGNNNSEELKKYKRNINECRSEK